MAIVVIPSRIERKIKDIFDTDKEIAVWFLAEKRGRALAILTMDHSQPGEENRVSPLHIVPNRTLATVRRESDRYEFFSGHLHTRSYGSVIQPFDPYWTITVNDGSFIPGQVVDGKFYVSRKTERGRPGGDSRTLEALTEFGKAQGIQLTKTLFVHPAYGYEGKVMYKDLVQIHGYEYDPAQRLKVKDLPIVRGEYRRHNPKSE